MKERHSDGQGDKYDTLVDNIHTATMYHKSRKCRSEAQLRHDTLLHKSRYDLVAYQVASLEDMSNTVKQYRERARVAEADAEHSKKALFETQNQVSPLGTDRL